MTCEAMAEAYPDMLDRPVGPPDKCFASRGVMMDGRRLTGAMVWGGTCTDAEGTVHASLVPAHAKVHRNNGAPDPCWTEEETQSIGGIPGGWTTSQLLEDEANCYHSSTSAVCSESPYSCSGIYSVEVGVLPEDVAWDSPLCEEYHPYFLNIWGDSYFAGPETTAAADCAPGGGRFTLAPHTSRDRDHDGRFAVTFVPMMLNGTGAMTRGAWVTSITPVSPWPVGSVRRVVTTTGPYAIADDDTLAEGPALSQLVTGPTNFAPGALVGNPIFFGEGLQEPFGPYDVDMTWTCPTGRPVVSRPPGWQIPLSAMGCPLQQKVTLRHDSVGQRVIIEPYGTPALSATVPTTPTSTGHRFVWERPGLYVDATLVSGTPQQATVRLDSVMTQMGPVCTPGTYTMVAE